MHVDSLPPDIQRKLDTDSGQYIASLTGSRWTSQQLPENLANLLEKFRIPSTIPEAIVRHVQDFPGDAKTILADSYDAMKSFIDTGYLVNSEKLALVERVNHLKPGDKYKHLTVVRPLKTTNDTEVYELASNEGMRFALKVTLKESDFTHVWDSKKEVEILRFLTSKGVDFVPKVLDFSSEKNISFTLLSWVNGIEFGRLSEYDELSFPERAQIVEKSLECMSRIHNLGVLHGDINPGNFLVDDSLNVSILDFGAASAEFAPQRGNRVGVFDHYEPEYACAVKTSGTGVESTSLGEQYSMATLAFLVITGRHYLNLSLEREKALVQIVGEAPRRLSEFEIHWPMVEDCLNKALEKDPSDRFSSMKDFCNAFAVSARQKQSKTLPKPFARTETEHSSWTQNEKLSDSGVEGTTDLSSDILENDSCFAGLSMMNGAAGAAYISLQCAVANRSAKMLSGSNFWISKMSEDWPMKSEPATATKVPEDIWDLSLFHGRAGHSFVRTIHAYCWSNFSLALDELNEFEAYATSFLDNMSQPRDQRNIWTLDTYNGGPGILLGAAFLKSLLGPILLEQGDVSFDHFDAVAERILNDLTDTEDKILYLGFAHGRAGILFSLLRWYEVKGTGVPRSLVAMLDKHITLSETFEDMAYWPITTDPDEDRFWSGLCNGASGHLLLYSLAYSMLGSDDYFSVAEKSANFVLKNGGQSGISLCCGMVGEAFALMHWARRSNSRSWQLRSENLIRRSILDRHEFSNDLGLLNGLGGVALASSGIQNPSGPIFPILEDWRTN